MSNEAIVITGEERIRLFALLSQRGALRMETRGMKRRGRSVLSVVNERMGTKYRTAKAAYPAFDAWLVKNFGESHNVESWPL